MIYLIMIKISSSINKIIFQLLIFFSILIVLNISLNFFSIYLLLSLAKAIGLILIFILYGYFILRLFKKNIAILESLSIGMIFTTFVFLLLSFVKSVNISTISFFYVFPFILLMIFGKINDLTYSFKKFFQQCTTVDYIIFLIPLLYSFLPSSFYDTLVYHLGIPNIIIQYNGFINTPNIVYFNTSIYYEIGLVPITFAGDLVPRIFHFIIGLFFLISIINFSIITFKIKNKTLLFLFILSMPLSMFLLTTIKNDLIVALFIFLGIKHFYNNKYLSAIFWGFSFGVKYFSIIPFTIFILIQIFNKRLKVKELFKFFSIYSLIIFPLFIKNIIYIGNPVYPFLYNIFYTEFWDLSRSIIMKNDVGQITKTISNFIRLPFDISFNTYGFVGHIGVQFLVFLPFLIFVAKKHNTLFYFSILTLFTGSYFSGSIRFFYIVFLILSIYIVYIIESNKKKVLIYLAIIIIFINIGYSIVFQENLYLLYKFYSGKLNIETYKSHLFPSYEGFKFINTNTPKNSKILLVGEARNFYLKRKYIVSSALDFPAINNYINNCKNYEDFKNNLKKNKINYIFLSKSELLRTYKKYNRFSNTQLKRYFTFLEQFPLVYENNEVFIYKI